MALDIFKRLGYDVFITRIDIEAGAERFFALLAVDSVLIAMWPSMSGIISHYRLPASRRHFDLKFYHIVQDPLAIPKQPKPSARTLSQAPDKRTYMLGLSGHYSKRTATPFTRILADGTPKVK